MWWCLDEGGVPALHKAASLWVPDSVKIAFVAIAARLPFSGRGVELPGILHVHEGSSSDGAKVQKVGFLAVKHLEWCLRLEHLVRSPVLQVRSHHEQPLPHGRWKAAVFEHAPNHSAQSSVHAFGHTDFLRRVGGGELLDNVGLQAVLSKLLLGVLLALVGAPTNGAPAERNNRRDDEQLKLSTGRAPFSISTRPLAGFDAGWTFLIENELQGFSSESSRIGRSHELQIPATLGE